MFKKNFKTKGGYTIIETMIAISIFLVIVMEGMGALLNANLLHNKAQNLRSIMDNLSFIMEDMSRNIRTGYNYHCFLADSSGTAIDSIPSTTSNIVSVPKSGQYCWAMSFEYANGQPSNDGVADAKDNDQWVYYISGGKIFKSTQGPYASSIFYQLTPDEVVINAISGFSILGAEPPPGDSQQPFVTIRLVGNINFQNIATPFSLQTSLSQRLIDI